MQGFRSCDMVTSEVRVCHTYVRDRSLVRAVPSVRCFMLACLPAGSEADFEAAGVDPEIGAVVCGWDLEFSYPKLCFASLCLQANPGCVFVATNLDATDRLGHRFIPGNGCQVAAIQAAASTCRACRACHTLTWDARAQAEHPSWLASPASGLLRTCAPGHAPSRTASAWWVTDWTRTLRLEQPPACAPR